MTGIDLSEKMIDQAEKTAIDMGFSNIVFQHMDAEELDFTQSTFDVAINSLGLMYYPDPDKAVAEMYRVLRAGGRASALVWGRRSDCGWAEIFPIVDRRVKSDVCPLFFQLGTGNTLSQLFSSVGFQQVNTKQFSINLEYKSDNEAIIGAFLGGAVALAYRKFDEQTKEEVHAEYIDSIQSYWNGSSYEIPGEFVIVTGKK